MRVHAIPAGEMEHGCASLRAAASLMSLEMKRNETKTTPMSFKRRQKACLQFIFFTFLKTCFNAQVAERARCLNHEGQWQPPSSPLKAANCPGHSCALDQDEPVSRVRSAVPGCILLNHRCWCVPNERIPNLFSIHMRFSNRRMICVNQMTTVILLQGRNMLKCCITPISQRTDSRACYPGLEQPSSEDHITMVTIPG